MIARALVGVALVLALVATPARGDDAADERAFSAASARLAAGDGGAARAQFEALAAANPTGGWADDALAEAATLAEAAGDRAGARRLWTTLVRDHADGRLARRGHARLAALDASGGVDGRFDAVAAEHARLLAVAAAAEDPQPALRALGALLDQHPDYPRWFAAAIGLGDGWARLGARVEAARWLERARTTARDPEERFRVELALAGLEADAGDLDRAWRHVDGLRPPSQVAAAAQDELRRALAQRRLRRTIGRGARGAAAALVVLAGFVVWRRRRVRGGLAATLWPPPIEVVFQAPIAAGFVLVARTGNALAARAVERLVIGGLVLTWIASAVARTLPTPSRWARLGFVAAVALAAIALGWIVVDDDALLDLLIETWRSGHDL